MILAQVIISKIYISNCCCYLWSIYIVSVAFSDAVIISNYEALHFMETRKNDPLLGAGMAGAGGIYGFNQIGEEMRQKTEKYLNKFQMFDKKLIKSIRE